MEKIAPSNVSYGCNNFPLLVKNNPAVSDVWSVARVYKKKRQALPNPSDSRSGALSVGPGVVNHWSVPDVFYGIALNCLCSTEKNDHPSLR